MRGRTSRFFCSMLVFLGIFSVVAGCSTKSDGSKQGSSTGPKVLRIGRPIDAITLDPWGDPRNWSRQVYDNIVETLVLMDSDMKVQPRLATSWKQVDEVTWLFNLRKNVKFHSGTPFTAKAVKFSLERMIDPKNPSRSAGLLSGIKSVDVVDDQTVQIKTNGPGATLLFDLTPPWAAIVDPSQVEKVGHDKFGSNPSGTGPFKFDEWKVGQSITLVRNDDWWGGKVPLDKVIFQVIPDDSARMLALRNKEIDMNYRIPPHEIPALKADKNVDLQEFTGVRSVFFMMNVNQPHLNDRLVRQAINHAVNVDQIVSKVLENQVFRTQGYFTPVMNGFQKGKGLYAFDANKAVALLQQAGYTRGADGVMQKNGQQLKTFIDVAEIVLNDTQVAEALQQQLKQVGISAEIRKWDAGGLQGLANQGKSFIQLSSWGTQTGDADYAMYNNFHSSKIAPKGWNQTFYNQPKVDELLDLARKQLTLEDRARTYSQVMDIVGEDAIFVPLYDVKEMAVVNKYVQNYRHHPGEHMRLWMVDLAR